MVRSRAEQDPTRPAEAKALAEALVKLLDEAGLTAAAIARGVPSPTKPGESMSAQLFSENMNRRTSGPSDPVVNAIVEAAAETLQRPAHELFTTITPLVRRIRGREQFEPTASAPVPAGESSTQPQSKAERIFAAVMFRRGLAEKTSWLLALLIDGQECQAVAEVGEVFGDDALLVAALTDIGETDPGAVAAFLQAVADEDSPSARDELVELLREASPWVADRVVEIPLCDEPEPEPEPEQPEPVDTSVLDLRAGQKIGRRLISLLDRGNLDQARREIMAAEGRFFDNLLIDVEEGTDSVLAGMLETPRGPELVSAVADTLMSAKGQRALVNLVREMLRYTTDTLPGVFVAALSQDTFSTLVAYFSYRPHFTDEPFTALSDLVELLDAASVEQQTATFMEDDLVTFPHFTGEYVALALTDVEGLLMKMAETDTAKTARFLTRLVADCDAHRSDAPEQNPAVAKIGTAILRVFLDDRALGRQITTALFSDHPQSVLLLRSMQISRSPGYTALLEDIGSNAVLIAATAELLASADSEIRLPGFTAFLDAPTIADPLLRATATRHPEITRHLLHDALDKPSPALAEAIVEILDQLHPASGWHVVAGHLRNGDISTARTLTR